MSSMDEISKVKEGLNKTKTRVTNEDGATFTEAKKDDGSFEIIFDDPNTNPMEGFKKNSWGFVLDMNPDLLVANVTDGVFLSSQDVAQDLDLLKKNNITHIVNVATGIMNCFPNDFTYLAINAMDCPSQNLRKHFPQALKFMRNAVQNGGNVLVHCNAGISRSSTIAIAYIMYFEKKTFSESYAQVKKKRSVARPNLGFTDQLKEFEADLKKGFVFKNDHN